MGLTRLIILAAIIWLAWFFYQRYQQNIVRRKQVTSKKANTTSSTIVKCAVCGVHVPKSEALEADGQFYCSESHKNQ